MSNSHKSNDEVRLITELNILRGDAERVDTPSVRIQILNTIAQKETKLHLLRVKSRRHVAPTPMHAPTAPPRGKARLALGINRMKEIEISQGGK
jgi:hypothetical protein